MFRKLNWMMVFTLFCLCGIFTNISFANEDNTCVEKIINEFIVSGIYLEHKVYPDKTSFTTILTNDNKKITFQQSTEDAKNDFGKPGNQIIANVVTDQYWDYSNEVCRQIDVYKNGTVTKTKEELESNKSDYVEFDDSATKSKVSPEFDQCVSQKLFSSSVDLGTCYNDEILRLLKDMKHIINTKFERDQEIQELVQKNQKDWLKALQGVLTIEESYSKAKYGINGLIMTYTDVIHSLLERRDWLLTVADDLFTSN